MLAPSRITAGCLSCTQAMKVSESYNTLLAKRVVRTTNLRTTHLLSVLYRPHAGGSPPKECVVGVG
jgi:hypothetical protein